jgi:ABC-2 type transport system permease protein
VAGEFDGGAIMKAFVIAANSVRLLFRDRSNIFFVLILPVILILVFGLVFGSGFTPRIGIVILDDSAATADLNSRLETADGLDVIVIDNEEEARLQVRRNQIDGAMTVPAGYGEQVTSGTSTTLSLITAPSSSSFQVQTIVNAAVTEHAAALRAGRFAADVTGTPILQATELAAAVDVDLPRVTVATIGSNEETDLGQFGLGAVSNLVMFVFLTATTSSAALIQARQLGVSRRMFSTPTSASTIIAGETLGRYLVTLLQGLFIIGIAALAFGVQWGNPLGAALLMVTFSLVGTGAGILIGTTFSNAEQAAGLSVFFSLLLAALGGAMVPLEIFPDTMRQIAHITPHAWAIDGYSELIRLSGTALDIVRELGVLLAMGAALLALSTWQFRRVLTR